jgi:hypothetical protein
MSVSGLERLHRITHPNVELFALLALDKHSLADGVDFHVTAQWLLKQEIAHVIKHDERHIPEKDGHDGESAPGERSVEAGARRNSGDPMRLSIQQNVQNGHLFSSVVQASPLGASLVGIWSYQQSGDCSARKVRNDRFGHFAGHQIAYGQLPGHVSASSQF